MDLLHQFGVFNLGYSQFKKEILQILFHQSFILDQLFEISNFLDNKFSDKFGIHLVDKFCQNCKHVAVQRLSFNIVVLVLEN